jgi:CxxC-x17-CxxC domain-containing protein
MRDFNQTRKPGGFGAKGGFGDRGASRGGFGKPQRGGFGSGRDSERPMMHKAVCSDCGNDCEVPFRPNGTKPVLCSSCFSVQKDGGDRKPFAGGRDRDRGRDFSASSERTMFKATCQECGAACELPFRPSSGKPVFCSDCFRGSDQPHKAPKDNGKHQEELTAIHAKLDQIMNLLKTGTSREEKAEKKSVVANVEKASKEAVAVVAPKKVKVAKVVKKEVKVKKAPAKKKKV